MVIAEREVIHVARRQPRPLEKSGADSSYLSPSPLQLHIEDIRSHPILEIKEERQCGSRIFVAQLALMTLQNIAESDLPTQSQRRRIEDWLSGETRESKSAQFLLEHFKMRLTRIRKKGKSAHRKDQELLGIYGRYTKNVERHLGGIRQIDIAELREQRLGDFIDFLAGRVFRGVASSDILINNNLKLVFDKVGKRKARDGARGLPLEDLVVFGHFGLITAVAYFDFRRGFKFSTYATNWINQAIDRGIKNEGSTVRVPTHAQEAFIKAEMIRGEVTRRLGRKPTLEDLAEELAGKISRAPSNPKKVRQTLLITARAKQVISLDQPVQSQLTNEEGSRLSDFIEDRGPSVEERAGQALLKQQVAAVILATLTPRERKIVELRFGMEDGRARTLEEVGREFDVTRERIRQIEAKALRKLRAPEKAEKLRPFW